jgi:N-acetylneuraminic acid mutarotase
MLARLEFMAFTGANMKTTLWVIVLAAVLTVRPAAAQSKESEEEKNHYILCDFKCVDAMPWVPTGKMNIARAGHTATLLADGKVLVVGGGNGSADAIDSAELYDPRSRSWTVTGRLNVARFADTATLLADGRVLVTGGFSHGGFTNTAEVYEPATGAWTRTGNMSTLRAGHSATLLQDGRVLVAGGQGRAGLGALKTAEVFDPATGTWSRTGDLNFARIGHAATRLLDGRVLVVRGQYGDDPWGGEGVNGDVTSAELYDPMANTWTIAASSSAANGTATLLASGKVLVVGGSLDEFTPYPKALTASELFDPDIGAWIQTRPLAAPHYSHTATLLPNGNVLVVGGLAGTFDSAEEFDPNTATWTSISRLNTARAGQTASVLPDGSVLVAGGWTTGGDSMPTVLDSAELLGP